MFDLPLIDLPPVPPDSFLWQWPVTIPLGIWIAWSDMKFMRIPNEALVTLALSWVLLAWLIVPWQVWLVGLPVMVLAYVVAGLLYATGAYGAGDLKMMAAMSPFFIGADPRHVMLLFAACLLGALIAHRGARLIPAFRGAAPDWASWTHRKFPMGLALSGLLIFHPILAAISS